MRALKALVVVMGIMLIGGFAVLVAVIIGRVSRGGPPLRSFSPTALQNFAACPYRFFLQAILRLEPRQEPVAIETIDPLTRDELSADYRRIHDRLGLTTLLVTHDMTEAFLLADRVALMRDGRLVQVGTPSELFKHPADDFVRMMIESPRRRAQALNRVMREGR